MTISTAVADTNWFDEPEELYLTRGDKCEVDRPIYQGDVFSDVPLPALPKSPPPVGMETVEFKNSLAMIVPHPCQCYHGDTIRPTLTVAPVREAENYDNFGPDKSGAKDKFALPDLIYRDGEGQWVERSCVADFGKLISLPSKYFSLPKRVACLTHKGLGLLAKRVVGFQARYPLTLGNAMAFTAGEWNESFLMQAWVRRHGSLSGYSKWMRTPIVIEGVNDGEPIAPYDVRGGALDSLLGIVGDLDVVEPG